MNALVIGGTGPTGPHIISGLLGRGYEVAILHRGVHEIELPFEVEHIHCDPHFAETFQKALGKRHFDVVVCSYGRLRIIAEVMRQKTDRLIAAGGISYQMWVEAINNLEGCPVPIPEDAPLVNDPAFHKFYYLLALSERTVLKNHKEGHYNATYLRFPHIYGPRAVAPREWSIIRRILDGRKVIIVPDNGLKLLYRGYVENVAHAVLLVLDKSEISGGKAYNVCDEKCLSTREWIAAIAKTLKWDGKLVSMPYEIAKPCYPYASTLYFHEVIDNKKIINELGYHDLVPVEEALRKTVKMYVESPPERNGQAERQLGDPFDYKGEDLLIEEFERASVNLMQVPFAGFERHHPYPHPREVGDVSETSTYVVKG